VIKAFDGDASHLQGVPKPHLVKETQSGVWAVKSGKLRREKTPATIK